MNCKGCKYWKLLNGTDGTMACHYLLEEGHSRKKDGDKCLSWKAKRKAAKREWPLPR